MSKKNRRYKSPSVHSQHPKGTAKSTADEIVADAAVVDTPKNKKPIKGETPHGKSKTESSDFYYFDPEKRGLWPGQLWQSGQRPFNLVPRDWRKELPHLFAVFMAVLLLYAYTTPRLVTLEDDGLFISNLHFFGVAHPPGYPAHTFFGGLFYHLLPFGTPAFKGHFFSGFVGAIACSALYAIVAMIVRGRVFAYMAGLAYAFSDTFWSQAIIAEVYTLNSMIFFVVMALCLHYAGHSGRSGRSHRQVFIALTFIYGIGMANHYPLLGLGSIGLGMIVLSQIGNILPRIPLGVFCVLASSAPLYVWMVWRSGYQPNDNPANFYGPIGLLGMNEKEKVVDFDFYFLRSGYSGVDKQAGVGLDDKLAFSEALGYDFLWQFTPLGFIFVVLGFCAMARSRYHWLWLSLTVSWFMSSVLLIYLLDFKAEFIWMAAFRVYHLLAFGIMAIWMAVGAAWFIDHLRFMSEFTRRQCGGFILVSIILFTATTYWPKNNRRDYNWAHNLAMAKLNSVEKDAVLFTFDDLDLPVGYLHFVENQRPDLKVYNDQALVYGDRLYSPLVPDKTPPHAPQVRSKQHILRKFIEKNDRPLYYHAGRQSLYSHPRYGSDFMGFFRRVNRDGAFERIILSDYLRLWLSDNLIDHNTIADLWTRQQQFSTVAQLANAVQLASFNGLELNDEWGEVIDRVLERNVLARLSSNSQKINFGKIDEETMERELAWMKSFKLDQEPLLGRQMRALFFWQKAFFARHLKDESVSLEGTLKQGYAENPTDKGNPATQELVNFYEQEERHCDFVNVLESVFPKAEDIPKNTLPALRQARRKGNCAVTEKPEES